MTERPKASVTISAGPQVRDLKKEALSFAPAALKRKRPVASGSGQPSSKAAKAAPQSESSVVPVASSMAVPPGMALPPGFGPSVTVDEESDGEGYSAPGPALPIQGSYAPLPGYGDEEEDEDGYEYADQGVALPPADFQGTLPGLDDEEEEGDGYEQDVARPPAGYQSTLPGYDSGDDQNS